LIVAALEQENKVGIAKTVLGAKEQIVAIRAREGQMLLYTMHFSDEIQPGPAQKGRAAVNPKELALAKNIVDNMTARFEPDNYKNEYREKLLAAIEAKVNGQEIKGEKFARAVNIADLMDALKKSVEETAKRKPNQSEAAKGKSKAAGKKLEEAVIADAAKSKSGRTGSRVH